MANSPKISIAIVGGGIGGLSLAAGLQNCSHIDVHVYEGTKVYKDVGGGLAIHPNGIRAMELLGDDVKRAYFNSAELSAKDEDVELTMDVLVAQGKNAHQMLASLGAAKISSMGLRNLCRKSDFILEKRLSSIQEKQNGKIALHFEDGSQASADCLIGADGIHSKTRSYLLGEDHPATAAKDQGWILFRRPVPMEEARLSLNETLLTKVPIYCGLGSAINCMPVHGGRTYQITVTAVKAAAWNESDDNETLVVREDYYKDWVPEVKTIVELLNKDPGEPWIIEDHDPAPYYYRGSVVMLGDAAHAITPFAGNGASQAFEDAATMLALLKEVTNVSQIPKAFEAFDAIRRPRSQKVVELSRMFGRLYAFMEEDVGDDLNKIRMKMGEAAAIMNDANLQEQNEEAVSYFKGLLSTKA